MPHPNETWKTLFVQQTDTGKFWRELFKGDFDEHSFLDRSDAVVICKKAQYDIIDFLLKKKVVTKEVLQELREKLLKTDDSALGLIIKKHEK